MGFFFKKKTSGDGGKLNEGLQKTRKGFLNRLNRLIVGDYGVDSGFLDRLEELLIASDMGVSTTLEVVERVESKISGVNKLSLEELNGILKREIMDLLPVPDIQRQSKNAEGPFVLMVVGVNGVGKTTTIGKLAKLFSDEGKKVLLGAADTFRAAAIDQLQIWGDRVGCHVVSQAMGSDPASVAHDAVSAAKTQNADVVIVDTAGRLHNKVNLMNELTKIKRVMSKVCPGAPHEVMLVIDGSTGQNAFQQAKQFSEATQITSLSVTKLDGTAKGGVVIGISNELNIPIRFVGVGEGIDDLEPFDKETFVESFFQRDS